MPFEWSYLDTQYFSLYEKDRQMTHIFKIGLAISILIAALGIFSISALMTTLRAKEMGIRKVVGATALQLFGLHVKRFGMFLIACILLACPLVYWFSQIWLSNFAYRIELNLYHFLIPGAMAAALLLLTICYHAAKGSQVNPVDQLKCE